ITSQSVDLVLLDVMLPGLDGFEVCKAIRKTLSTPIIMLTARVEEIDRLIGLELGADDYVCKPFSPREVVARVKTVLRRQPPKTLASQNASTPTTQGITIDCDAFCAYIFGKRLECTPSEFKLLSALASRPGKVWSREQLLNVFSDEKNVFDRTIDSHIKNIRKKLLAIAPDQDIIQSVYGVGYRLEL
ncbi:MAG: winged helix-turn-helix domain-containing protein, partial [Betaproteobacteria bacterium]